MELGEGEKGGRIDIITVMIFRRSVGNKNIPYGSFCRVTVVSGDVPLVRL